MANKAAAAEAKNKGNAAFKENRHQEAIKHYSEAIRLDPADQAFYTNRAASLSALGKHQEALADADKAIQLNQSWMKGHYRRGCALFSLDRFDDALAAFRRALQLEPQNPDVALRVKEAEQEVKQRRPKGGPKTFDGEKEEGNELYKQGKYEEAVSAYTRALALSQNNEQKATILSNRAAAYSQMKHYDKVIKDCNEVIELDPHAKLPTTQKALVRRGLAYEDAEKWEQALEDMQRVIILNPNLKQASDSIARLRRNLEQKKKLKSQEKFHA